MVKKRPKPSFKIDLTKWVSENIGISFQYPLDIKTYQKFVGKIVRCIRSYGGTIVKRKHLTSNFNFFNHTKFNYHNGVVCAVYPEKVRTFIIEEIQKIKV